MVYDPIRDCDVPSPAISRRYSQWHVSAPPVPAAFAEVPTPVHPVSAVTGGSSSRSFLNQDGDVGSHRNSDRTVSSHDEEGGNRPNISKLPNETPRLVRMASTSSVPDPSWTRDSSPSMSLHPSSAVLARRAPRSPTMIYHKLSSRSTTMGHSYDHYATPGSGYGGGPSSRRSSIDTTRPMPSPPEPIRTTDLYGTPGFHSGPLPSPSGSVSPGSQAAHLPHPGSSRPTSSRSASASSPFAAVHPATASPESSTRRVWENHGSIVAPNRTAYPPAQPSHSAAIQRSINAGGRVASHYNMRPDVGIESREYSPIIGLKRFNNWVKTVLIGKFSFRARGQAGAKVMDIGCGKGGDLRKWKQVRIQLYVGMDIAATSVDQARGRYNKMRGNNMFDAYFYAHDCYGKSIGEVLPSHLQRPMYDNVTMQFCMHYAFETASKAHMLMENVSRYLRRGGVFIGTIPNSQLLLERLDEVPEGDELAFGNSCCSIAFNERRHNGVYGHKYRFYLEDAVEDVPEYIVDWDNFVNLAGEYGLELIYRKAFNDVLQEEQDSRKFGPLLGKMGVINEDGESAMDSDQWETASELN